MARVLLCSTIRTDTDKFTLTDLSRKELTLVYQNREYEKSSRKYANYFAGCMIASFVLAIALTQKYHNFYISSVCFLPIIGFFVLNSIRNRRVKSIVEKLISQKNEKAPVVSD
jgi:hypothetical protein